MMAKTPPTVARELQSIAAVLEKQLEKLDELGSGIAAIHVDAAIQQVYNNLQVVNDNLVFEPFAELSAIPTASIAKSIKPS